MNVKKYDSLKTFYPFYLSEHNNDKCRYLHFIGTSISVVFCLLALLYKDLTYFAAGVFIGYLFAWTGHFVFEKNRPASFKQPIYSFLSDFIMWFQMITRKLK